MEKRFQLDPFVGPDGEKYSTPSTEGDSYSYPPNFGQSKLIWDGPFIVIEFETDDGSLFHYRGESIPSKASQWIAGKYTPSRHGNHLQ
jgi:hypothetical protein